MTIVPSGYYTFPKPEVRRGRQMADELNEDDKREALARFEAVGIPAVQQAVFHGKSSPEIFGVGEKAIATEALAKEWLLRARPRERNRVLRHEALLWAGLVAAALAALFSGLMLFG